MTDCGQMMEANLRANVKPKSGGISRKTYTSSFLVLGSSSSTGEDSDLLCSLNKLCLAYVS